MMELRLLPFLLSALRMSWQSQAFSTPSRAAPYPRSNHVHQFTLAETITEAPTSTHHAAPRLPTFLQATYLPVFDFTQPNSTTRLRSLSSFERIDDAIMGGISQSSLRDVPARPYASWSGVCRTDGGGFCGTRTLPLKSPLNATGMDGVYLDCRLASDDDTDRRVWKMSVRTDESRGEMVYQAEYDLKEALDEASETGANGDGGWARVMVPFDKFKLVRGPRLVIGGPELNVTGGIYQIGMTMSKFNMAQNMTELENFRPGFFDMHIRRMGFYNNNGFAMERMSRSVPETLTKEEAQKKRPILLKMLLPLARVFFSETANRRKSAMRILREERELSRGGAILFGLRSRSGSMGRLRSLITTAAILSVDTFRAVAGFLMRIAVVYPLILIRKLVRMAK